MYVLVIASQKGGSSKTSLAAHLAVSAELSGAGPVAMLDTDPQETLTAWWQQREAETPALAPVKLPELAGKLEALRNAGYALAVIDTPPAITASIRTVIALADFVLIPVRPSPADLWAVGATLDLCKVAKRPYAFVLTQATRGATITTQALGALSEHGAVCGTVMHSRVSYAGVLTSGQTVQEVEPDGTAAGEIGLLWEFVRTRLMPSTKAKKAFIA
jgi:chromosome partitioning protein